MSDYFSHSTAIIDDGAEIGIDTKIWHWSHISAGAHIGEKCSLGQNVYVASNTHIGNNVKIQNNVSVYDNVVIEDDVFCGPSIVFTNVLNPRSFISRKSEYKKTTVRQGSTLGANATIICGIEIGRFSFIAAGSVVTKDTLPFSLMMGVPARHVGWMSAYGNRIDLPIKGNGDWTCPSSNEQYQLIQGKIKQVVGN